MKAVGARLPRYDGLAHVTGRTQYVDDVRVHGTLWCKALRSPHHSAVIRSIDTSKAQAMPGVHAAVNGEVHAERDETDMGPRAADDVTLVPGSPA